MKRGFDAFVGNPPWVSYAGRAAQPLADGQRDLYAATYESFAGYRNLQGMFIERTASLLGPLGRLGLVVPSSMSEQSGYAPTRIAHARRCACDENLRDLGTDSFPGVFQPCMALQSTRRPEVMAPEAASPWPVERNDLDALARELLEKLTQTPLPTHIFGERGIQTSGEDTEHMLAAPDEQHCIPLRVGGDIEPFRLGPPSIYCDPTWFGKRLRPPHEWAIVRVVIRQTARVPMAALSDGVGFRNSLLACFEDATYPAPFLVAYLNATPIRWQHYMRHRDARQGMPQMKIGHLRAIPAPPTLALVSSVAELGATLSARNEGADVDWQARLDALVSDAFALTSAERVRIAQWAEETL